MTLRFAAPPEPVAAALNVLVDHDGHEAAVRSNIHWCPADDESAAKTPLQLAHAKAKRRAADICQREPGVISIYSLGEVIAAIKADQILHGELHQLDQAIALNRVIGRLNALLPTTR